MSTPAGEYVVAVSQLPPSYLNGDAYVAVLAPLNEFVGPIYRAGVLGAVLSSVAVLIAIPLVIVVARSLSMPMRALAMDADRIRNLEIDRPITVRSRIKEVRQLLEATVSMKAALSAFVKYVPQELVRGILESGDSPEPGGAR